MSMFCKMPEMKHCVFIAFFCCLLFVTCSCNRSGVGKTNTQAETQRSRARKAQLSIVSPENNTAYTLGSNVVLSVKLNKDAGIVDSLRWLVDGKLLKKAEITEDVTWNTKGQAAGTHRIEAVAHYSAGQRDMLSASVLLLAEKAPKQYTYKVMQTYPHDPKAYTQGLLFDNGFLYESTGLNGESSLRKVDVKTGNPIQVMNMPSEMFGEGLAEVDGKLIQLTWKNRVAFVYQKSDFKLLKRIGYTINEGWGLAYDGVNLLMTDGSAHVYFLDKEYLTEIRRIEVCDNKSPVRNLNELEYINGELWANVYGTDNILRIDATTGVVLGSINMKGLLRQSDRHAGIDVLNGIACDEKTGKIYVTGKNWPKLFEIQVMEK